MGSKSRCRLEGCLLILTLLLLWACGDAGEPFEPAAAGPKEGKEARQSTGDGALVFQRVWEPRERAFSFLLPAGWDVEGGIFRVDPTAQGGPSQSIAAKLDLTIKKGKQGGVLARWLPDVLYYDSRYSPAGQMGLFPVGSNYQGMTVYPLMSAEQFLKNLVFPLIHPNAGEARFESRALPELASHYQQRIRSALPFLSFSYSAAVLEATYSEGGELFKERLFSLVEDWGSLGAGMWGNKETYLIRAPAGELERWLPVFGVIQRSVQVNPAWLLGEIKGQLQRAGTVLRTQQEIQRIESEIVRHRELTNQEIHNDVFLTLMEQEEYVNPYTNEIEVGSDQWKFRWVNESGDVVYTDREEYDPNLDDRLKRTDFKRTPVRPRFPE